MNVDDSRPARQPAPCRRDEAGILVLQCRCAWRAPPTPSFWTLTATMGGTLQVQASSVGGGEIVVNAIDGLEAGFSGHETHAGHHHHDTPGMIASISGELAAAKPQHCHHAGVSPLGGRRRHGRAGAGRLGGHGADRPDCRLCRASIMWPIWPAKEGMSMRTVAEWLDAARRARQPGCGGASLAGARAGRGPFCSPGADARAVCA